MNEPTANPSIHQLIADRINIQSIFTLAVICTIGINAVSLYKAIAAEKIKRAEAPYFFQGNKFSGLDSVLEGKQYVGYFTDKNLDDDLAAAQFAQAQFTLAPIVLDLNYARHEYIFFDCLEEQTALNKIKEMNLKPLKRNSFGIILAKKTKK